MDYRVLALDLWGFGDSDKSESRFAIDNHVAMLSTFISDIGMANPIIVGHALGAVVAIEYAAKNSEAVSKLMAISPPLLPDTVDRRLGNYPQSSVLSKVFRWKPIPNKEIEEDTERAGEKAISKSLESFSGYNSLAKLQEIDCNVLLVFGEKDDVVDTTPIKTLDNRLNHVRHIALPDSKHFPMVDESSKFNRLLKDFADADVSLDDLSLKEEWRRRTR